MHAPGAPSARVAHLVAVCNLKGGTGKSTLSVNLACALSEGGAAVALVDNDEQGSSSLWAGSGKLPVRCLHLPLLRAEGFAPWMRQLMELRAGNDILVVDFPAGVAPALAATLLMSSAVLVPCTPSGIEVAATRRMTRHLARLRAERPADPPAVMIVPTRIGEGGLTASGFRERLAAFGEELAPAVPLDATFDAAYASGDWVGGHAPGSVAHAEVAALAALVRRRLAVRQPAPWPPLRVAAAGRATPEALATPTWAGQGNWAPTPVSATGLAEAPAPALRVIYADERREPASRPARLARWALRLVGSGPGGR